MVGAPHMLVIGWRARMSSTRRPLKPPVGLWTSCAAPAMKGLKKELHAALAQPVSEMFQWRSSGARSSQYRAVVT